MESSTAPLHSSTVIKHLCASAHNIARLKRCLREHKPGLNSILNKRTVLENEIMNLLKPFMPSEHNTGWVKFIEGCIDAGTPIDINIVTLQHILQKMRHVEISLVAVAKFIRDSKNDVQPTGVMYDSVPYGVKCDDPSDLDAVLITNDGSSADLFAEYARGNIGSTKEVQVNGTRFGLAKKATARLMYH
jgi:hypothetical protein